MLSSNFAKHNTRCYVKNQFGVSKSEIVSLIQGNRQQSQLNPLQLKISKFEKFTENILRESRELIAELNQSDPEVKLNEMNISSSTLISYKSEWNQYSVWCKKRKVDPLLTTSANCYVGSLDKRTTTLKKKRSILQVILMFLTDRPVVLRKIRRRISIIPKYSMSPHEVTEYLEEQAKINHETYIIQLLLITYGCRIHSVACLTIGDLDFVRKKIFLPDSKTGTREVDMTANVHRVLKSFIQKINKPTHSTFVFSASNDDRFKRAAEICKNVNELIRQSLVLRKNQNYRYSSHMFRKTVAFTLFQRLVVDAKKTVRRSIGQSEGSSAVEYYI